MDKTLLNTVQRVLDKLNLDPVNSISDTEDSLLIAREAETTFYDMSTRADWPDQIDLVEINSVSDLSNPAALSLDDNVEYFDSLRYDVTTADDDNKVIRRICWLSPEDFLEKMYTRNTSNDNIVEGTYKNIPLLIQNDKMPEYYTSFDNKMLILDSYHSATEDSLQGHKTICYAKTIPSWLQDDTFVVPVQDSLYPLFIASLASACSQYLNSEFNQEDERRQQRGISRMRREAVRTEMEKFPKFNFGRKGNGLA